MLTYDEWTNITVRHVPSLYSKSDRFVSYKNISIHQVLPDIAFAGDWFQFGVFRGQTARILESFVLPHHRLHLFDSFEGLPEEWTGTAYGKGHFALDEKKIPRFDPSRTVIHRGWFADTLPVFRQDYATPIPFIHLDADLYSSTETVLEALNDLIVPRTVLLFDEFFLNSRRGLSDDEARAFHDWTVRHGRKFQYLWRTEWAQCAIRILA